MTEIWIGFGYGLVVAFAANAWWMNRLRTLKKFSAKAIEEAHALGRAGRDLDGDLLPATPFVQRERLD